MADYTVTLSAAVETLLNRDLCGNGKRFANIQGWLNDRIEGGTQGILAQEENKRFSALTESQKTAALTAGEAA